MIYQSWMSKTANTEVTTIEKASSQIFGTKKKRNKVHKKTNRLAQRMFEK